jgi:hypothetical protein
MVDTGLVNLITSVRASGEVSAWIGALGSFSADSSALRGLVSLNRFQENSTSCMSTLRPLTGGFGVNLVSATILAVSVSLSGDISHDSTRSPSTSPSVFCR